MSLSPAVVMRNEAIVAVFAAVVASSSTTALVFLQEIAIFAASQLFFGSIFTVVSLFFGYCTIGSIWKICCATQRLRLADILPERHVPARNGNVSIESSIDRRIREAFTVKIGPIDEDRPARPIIARRAPLSFSDEQHT